MNANTFLLFALTFALATTNAHAFELTKPLHSSTVHRLAKPHSSNKVCASLSETPDVYVERLDAEGQREEIVGQRLFNDDARQTLQCVAAQGQTQNYILHINNIGQSATAFHVSLRGSLSPTGAETPWAPKGCQARATYGDQTSDILAQLKSAQGWETPLINIGKEIAIKIQLTAPPLVTAPASSFRITASQGDKSDTAVVETSLQCVTKLQWSMDDIHWTDVTPATLIKAEQTDVIGLRAIKFHPDIDWPNSQPLGPNWTFHGDNFFGESVWLHAANLTDGDSEEATATLLDTFNVKIKVVPGDAFITYDKDEEDNQQ